jgi:outer membrane murein-binding lipoprotein Lpp
MKRLIGLLWLAALPAFAQEAGGAAAEDWERLGTQVRELREQARQLRDAAQQTHAAAQQACWKKFLVSACLEEARMALREKEREAKALEIEAGRIERRIRMHEREEKTVRREQELREQQGDIAERSERIRRKEEEAVRRQQEKQAEIERRQSQPKN